MKSRKIFRLSFAFAFVFFYFFSGGRNVLCREDFSEVFPHQKVLEIQQLKASPWGGTDGSFLTISPLSGKRVEHPFKFFAAYEMGSHRPSDKKPLVVIIPPILDATPWDYFLARFLATQGFHTVVLLIAKDLSNVNGSLKIIDRFVVEYMDKLQGLLDIAHKLPGVDSHKIGVFGLSLGGVLAAFALGIEKRLKAGVIYMGGSNIPEILCYGQVEYVTRFRQKKMQELGIGSIEEFKIKAQNDIHLDPVDFVGQLDAKSVYMFIAPYDQGIPTKNQYELWEAMGRPKRTMLTNMSHYLNGLIFPAYTKKVTNFFRNRLKN